MIPWEAKITPNYLANPHIPLGSQAFPSALSFSTNYLCALNTTTNWKKEPQ
jgi:hypothetical protein